MSIKLRGKGVVAGIVVAKAITLEQDLDKYIALYEPGTADEEISKVKKAISEVAEILAENVKTLTEKEMPEQAGIMEAHRVMVQDPMLLDNAVAKAGELKSAPKAALAAAKESAAIFENMDDAYFRERAVDIRDVGKRVVRQILGLKGPDIGSEPVILCGHEIEPSVIANVPAELIAGVVLGQGSTTCHAVIIAKARAVPTVVGLEANLKDIKTGDELILNGETGEVYVAPTEELIESFNERIKEQAVMKKRYAELTSLPAETTDGHKVMLVANISTHLDVEAAVTNFGAEGVGLFRSEFLFMGKSEAPDEETQFQAYKDAVEKCDGNLCVIRTMDIGGDKPLPYLNIPKEENPFLGWRALRICLSRRDIFMPQVKAILRAGVYGKAAIMLPMVIRLSEIDKVKQIVAEAKVLLAQENKPFSDSVQLGIMVETPAAAVMTPIFAKHVDFFSIGTNDLIQYTLAVDRVNSNVSYLYDPFNPGVLALIKRTIDSANENKIWAGMCGEMASDPMAAVILMAMGITELSMSAPSIPRVKELIRKVSMAEAKEAMNKIMEMEHASDIKEYLQEKFGSKK
ncbi:phosphoenolpyruvate--protein phosphotransferase [Pectinatus brassicae]|uniref:Phosphoenolpyruvate-protein phosphotransferase n=1 Tax=Pectinatus brassicae TaxID=862415 RepID=A0A840UKK7_9FIRM|nr:phosphoenolpyruvate--protein phosphotransferase [Pectinatus brassicae]MBB5336217.1 phosphotransferase system enzyme I (PtsI) [Pectinatus brassicae]